MYKTTCGRALSLLLLHPHTSQTHDRDQPGVLLQEGTAFGRRCGSSANASLGQTRLCTWLSPLACCLSFCWEVCRYTVWVLSLRCGTFACYATPKKWWRMECKNFLTEKKTYKGTARTLRMWRCAGGVLLHDCLNFSCYATAKKGWKMECNNFSTEKKTWKGYAWTLNRMFNAINITHRLMVEAKSIPPHLCTHSDSGVVIHGQVILCTFICWPLLV